MSSGVSGSGKEVVLVDCCLLVDVCCLFVDNVDVSISSTSSDGGYGAYFPHDIGFVQSIFASSSGILVNSSSFAIYSNFVGGGSNDVDDDIMIVVQWQLMHCDFLLL